MSRQPGDDRRLRLRDVFTGIVQGLTDAVEQRERIARILILIGFALMIGSTLAWILLGTPAHRPTARTGTTMVIRQS